MFDQDAEALKRPHCGGKMMYRWPINDMSLQKVVRFAIVR